MKKDDKKKISNLRKKAEKKLKPETVDITKLSEAEVRRLAHELQVHQIELDMQNEELRKSQVELEVSRDRYSRLYDFAPVGYFTISEKGIVLEVNLTGAKMLGIERGFLIGKSLGLFIVKEDQDIYYKQRNKVCKTKERVTCELRMVRKDSAQFYAQLESESVQDTGKNVARCMTIMSDITERKEMEEALLQSEKLKSLGIITAGISHEFNNILAVIMGNTELLGSGFNDDKELKAGLNTIIKASNDGVEIVKRMHTFSKAGASTSNYLLNDINYLIRQAIEYTMPRWKNMAQSEGINYHINTVGITEIPEVLCNPTELREVFVNIMNNAMDAMPDGGRISFVTESDGNTVFVSISDTGKDMSEDVKKKIFDPFFTTRSPQGTGLGMSCVYSIMKSHGGKIGVESEVGKGTTFNLHIPIRKDTVQRIVPPEPDGKITTKKLLILVVDDNEDLCVIMDKLLTRCGHTVKAFNTGADAIELAGEKDFDLVLCDLAMSGTTGYDVVKAFNKLDRRPKIGIITGWSEKLKLFDEEDMKVDFILKKPFKNAELTKHINELFI